MNSTPLICLLGPTASGKTSLAAQLARSIHGEIISADSRQVYKDMSIGTGKDLAEYIIDGNSIPYHLIDFLKAGERYTVFDFKNDCLKAISDIHSRNNKAILCGGTGMYLDAILFDYDLPEVKRNEPLRRELEAFSMEELIEKLSSLKALHNTTDLTDKERLIRAIEIASANTDVNQKTEKRPSHIESIVFGLRGERSLIKSKIEERLKYRLENGMIEEVDSLMKNGLSLDDLLYYGLEYKFIGMHLVGDISYNDMYQKLRSAIFNFSKKQMTWFRRMEKKGIIIHWLNIEDGLNHNLSVMLKKIES